jgi:hypothetical protein
MSGKEGGIMADLLDVNIEFAIKRGRIKEAADLLRKRGGSNGELLKMLADLIDPGIPKRMGRPIKTNTSEYRANQRFMMYAYYFLLEYYRAHKGWRNPATVARDAVLDAHECGKTFFEEAHKRYGSQMKKWVEMELDARAEHKLDFPEWVKNYDK